MENLLPLTLYSLSLAGYSQVNSAMPPEADLLYKHAMQAFDPEIKSTIEKNANN